jgi:hypothetical protein
MVKEFAITAQVYNNFDNNKQTLLVCESIKAESSSHARKNFEDSFGADHTIVKIYSVEEINAHNKI